MIAPRLFLCSGVKIGSSDSLTAGRKLIDLDSIGKRANVHICFENVAKVFHEHLSPRLIDFLEIASYVFSADCATNRGKAWTDDDGTEPWGRDLAFVIPVREPDFWNSSEVGDLITDVLTFLSNDKYSFTFVPLEHDRTDQQQYLEYGELEDWPFYAAKRVIMFSGGLDSLAGAVETARAGERLVLVSHRSVAMLDSRQRQLFNELKKEFQNQLIHIPVWINKSDELGRREPTQRTRSFLYAALGAVVAQSVQAGGVRFFENGIVSLNLPVAEEAIRARASRTTHPVALQLLKSLCSAVAERDLAVDNPYIFKTKTDVATILSANKAERLIPYTCSCAHLMFKSKTQWHCGTCSQCIDRRFAIIAAGLVSYDSDADYVSDVFLGPRRDGTEKNMAIDYTRHGIELGRRSGSELAARFNAELSRAVRYEAKRSEAAERIIAMHKRHGEVVTRVLKKQVVEEAEKLVEGTVDNSSLLSLVLGKKHLKQQPEEAPLAKVEKLLEAVLGRFDSIPALESLKKPRKRRNPIKRDTVIFAAIVAGLKGTGYCSFLDKYGIRPKWSDSGLATTYLKSYQIDASLRKKIQDEKTRAKLRMQGYSRPELATAINAHLPKEFDKISPLLAQLASGE